MREWKRTIIFDQPNGTKFVDCWKLGEAKPWQPVFILQFLIERVRVTVEDSLFRSWIGLCASFSVSDMIKVQLSNIQQNLSNQNSSRHSIIWSSSILWSNALLFCVQLLFAFCLLIFLLPFSCVKGIVLHRACSVITLNEFVVELSRYWAWWNLHINFPQNLGKLFQWVLCEGYIPYRNWGSRTQGVHRRRRKTSSKHQWKHKKQQMNILRQSVTVFWP